MINTTRMMVTYTDYIPMDTQVQSEEQDQRSSLFDAAAPQLFLVVYWIQSLLSWIGNGSTIVVFSKYRKLRTPSNVLVLFLATGDLMTTLISFMHTAMYFLKQPTSWVLYEKLCRTELCIFLMGQTENLHIMFLMGIDRFASVRFPYKYHQKATVKLFAIAGSITWIITIVSALYYIWAPVLQGHLAEFCEGNEIIGNGMPVVMVQFFLLTSCTTFLYGYVVYTIRKNKVKVSTTGTTSHQPKYQKDVTKLCLSIVSVYYICYIPFAMTTTLLPPRQVHLYTTFVTMLIFNNNMWINPCLYAWQNRGFRKALKSLLPGKRSVLTTFGNQSTRYNTENHQALSSVSNTQMLQIPRYTNR